MENKTRSFTTKNSMNDNESDVDLCGEEVGSEVKFQSSSSSRRKRGHSCISTLESQILDQTEAESTKKTKVDTPDTVKDSKECQNDTFFQLEIQRLIASPAKYKLQPVCHVCELFSDNSVIIRCTGVCLKYYHKECLNYPTGNVFPEDAPFQCPSCFINSYNCILCQKTDKITNLLYCENTDCGRLYHKECLETFNLAYVSCTEDSIKSCPAHYCMCCIREDSSCVRKPGKKLFQCIRCPMAFHDDDLCMAAGATELSLSQVVCPRHFEATIVKQNAFKPIHTDWCFTCFRPGAKVLCKYCPNSFHQDCLSCGSYSFIIDSPEKSGSRKETIFVCPDCRNHRQPRYGEIMFVKVGQYRWWPCEVIHPRNAPMNILRLKRPEGTFPIMFLGSREYQWVSKSRVIPYNVACLSPLIRDSCGTLKMDKEFNAGLEQAAKMHRVYVNILSKYVPLTTVTAAPMTKAEILPYLDFQDSDKTIVSFQIIKSNILIQPARLPLKRPPQVCDCIDKCEPYKCSNYISKVECDSRLCPATDFCHNQLFSTHTNKNLGVHKTQNRGFGLRTTEFLRENEFIIEFVGELITRSMSLERMMASKKSNVKDFYMVKLVGDLVVDAGPTGNLSRFINHSCNPTCHLERWIVDGYPRLGVFTNQDLGPDDELTLDYRLSGFILKEDMFCLCNSTNCSGFLGPEKMANISPSKTGPIIKGSILEILNSRKSTRTDESETRTQVHDDGSVQEEPGTPRDVVMTERTRSMEGQKPPRYYNIYEAKDKIERMRLSKKRSSAIKANLDNLDIEGLDMEAGGDKVPRKRRRRRKTEIKFDDFEYARDTAEKPVRKYSRKEVQDPGKKEIQGPAITNSEKKLTQMSLDMPDVEIKAAESIKMLQGLSKQLPGPGTWEHNPGPSEERDDEDLMTEKRALVNECLKMNNPVQEFISKWTLVQESRHQTQDYDAIMERVKATDAAVESLSKTILIKDSSNTILHEKEVRVDTKKNKENVDNMIISNHNNGTKIKKNEETKYESFCFRCFDGGQLVLCDKKGCMKTYHLSCLGLKKAPLGIWYCPWHFCNSCGEPSTLFCVQCPGSYCKDHLQDGFMKTPSPGSCLSLCHYHSKKNLSPHGTEDVDQGGEEIQTET